MQQRQEASASIQSTLSVDKNGLKTDQSFSFEKGECRESGNTEACRSAKLETNHNIVKATLNSIFTAFKKDVEFEAAPGVHATGRAQFGHATAGASIRLDKNNPQVEFKVGAWIAKFDGEIGTSKFCIDALNNCYEFIIKASGGLGWENSFAMGLDRNSKNTKIKTGVGFGPVKWNAELRISSQGKKSDPPKIIQLSENDSAELAKKLMPILGSPLDKSYQSLPTKLLDLIDQSKQNHLKLYAKSYANLLRHKLNLSTTQPTWFEQRNIWLHHKDEVLKDAFKELSATEIEEFLFTQMVEEEYFADMQMSDSSKVEVEQAKSAIKSITQHAKEKIEEFEKGEGNLLQEYQHKEQTLKKANIVPLKDNTMSRQLKHAFFQMSEVAVTTGWIAHFAGNTKLRNDLFSLSQATHLIPETFNTASKAINVVQGLFVGSTPLTLTSALSVFAPLAPLGALHILFSGIFSDEDDTADHTEFLIDQMCHYMHSLLQPVYEGLHVLNTNQQFMIRMQRVLREEVQQLSLDYALFSRYVQESFEYIRNQHYISQKVNIENNKGVLLGIDGIRSLIQEFRNDDITIAAELIETAIEMGGDALSNCLSTLKCLDPFIKAKAAVSSNALTGGEIEVFKENIQSILLVIRNRHSSEITLADGLNVINLVQDYTVSKRLDGEPLLPDRNYQKLSHPIGLYLLITLLKQMISHLHVNNKNIVTVFPRASKYLAWAEEEGEKLIKFNDDTNNPKFTRSLFYKMHHVARQFETQIVEIHQQMDQEEETQLAAKIAQIRLKEKQFIEREANFSPNPDVIKSVIGVQYERERSIKRDLIYIKEVHQDHLELIEEWHKDFRHNNMLPMSLFIYPENEPNGLALTFFQYVLRIFDVLDLVDFEKKRIGYLNANYVVTEGDYIIIKLYFYFYEDSLNLLIGEFKDKLVKTTDELGYKFNIPSTIIKYDKFTMAAMYWHGVGFYTEENGVKTLTEDYEPVWSASALAKITPTITLNQTKEELKALLNVRLQKYELARAEKFSKMVKDKVQTQQIPTQIFDLHLQMSMFALMFKDAIYAKQLNSDVSYVQLYCNLQNFIDYNDHLKLQILKDSKSPVEEILYMFHRQRYRREDIFDICHDGLNKLRGQYPFFLHSENNLFYQIRNVTQQAKSIIDANSQKFQKKHEAADPITPETPTSSASRHEFLLKPVSTALASVADNLMLAIFSLPVINYFLPWCKNKILTPEQLENLVIAQQQLVSYRENFPERQLNYAKQLGVLSDEFSDFSHLISKTSALIHQAIKTKTLSSADNAIINTNMQKIKSMADYFSDPKLNRDLRQAVRLQKTQAKRSLTSSIPKKKLKTFGKHGKNIPSLTTQSMFASSKTCYLPTMLQNSSVINDVPSQLKRIAR